MKLFHYVAVIILTMATATIQSCSSAEEAIPQKNEGYTLISRSDAQAQLDDLLDTNAYLDLDMSQPLGPNYGVEYSENAILARAIYYRFYQKTRVDNNRIVVDGTAADINVSDRAFEFCKNEVVDKGNEIIVKLLSMGYTPVQAVNKTYHVTPESIARIRTLR